MKVYILTEIDTQEVGFNPKNVYAFETMQEAKDKMVYLFNAMKRKMGIDDTYEGMIQLDRDYAYIDTRYYLDIYELETEHVERVMDTTNNHNPELVSQINILWNTEREQFHAILMALYARDFNDIYNAKSFADLGNNKGAAHIHLICDWEEYAGNYLQNIADDEDLETIIKFIR